MLGHMTTQPAAPSKDRSVASAAPQAWGRPVAVLALGSFAMGTDSFVLAGILPQIAGGLHESAGAAGQVITAFALTYGLAAPFLATFTSKLPRKSLMAFALTLFVLANLASAAAPTLALLLAARVAAGIGAALYTPSASAAAVTLAGPARRGRALAVILGGLTAGTVLGVPVGTAIGQHVSWRASLVFVAAVSVLALTGLLLTLPALPLPPAMPMTTRLKVLIRGRVLAMVVVMLLSSAASIMVYTYIAEVLGKTARTTGTALAIALLLWGIGGMAGAFGSGWLTDHWGASRTLLIAVGLLAVTLAALTVATSIALVMVVMALNGAAGWAVSTPNNHRLTALVPELPSVVISLNSSGIYLGQALGAALGGILLSNGLSVVGLCLAGAAIAVVALGLHMAIARTGTPGI
jgi:MFS transporter, DHA1 family, inner membrane transport protein